MIFLRITFIIFLSACKLHCQNIVVDSIFKIVQSQKMSTPLAENSLNIPYNFIVNDLNKSQIIFQAIIEQNVFYGNDPKTL